MPRKPLTAWTIRQPDGRLAWAGLVRQTRTDAITTWEEFEGSSWRRAYRRGCRCVRVVILPEAEYRAMAGPEGWRRCAS